MLNILKDLFKKESSPAEGMTPDGRLASDLWVDQPDAHQRLQRMTRKGEVRPEQAERLAHFVDKGYLTFSLDLPERVYSQVQADVDRVWREKPGDLAWANQGPLRSFVEADEARDRKPSYRIADLFTHSEAALELYLSRTVFEHVELILGQPAVATQALYFEYGSQQGLHRDPVFVQAKPASHLVAAWIALEDISPRCGPLVYVPGSHRLPYYQFEPGEHRYDQGRYGEAETRAMAEFDRQQVADRSLASEVFTCKRGDVLIWHASLLHGGSIVEDTSLTRRSYVVHFSTLAHHKMRKQRILERVLLENREAVDRPRIFETDRLLTRNGCHGLDNPMRGYEPPL
ncbi:MAG TPA: phytanoyl-CoA dioxygenase family protein [Thermoanaerobaculia bacterium]|nr:phytanoyl-CoA dioxygenase family protein [Thermoanaerobaculia bacterium]